MALSDKLLACVDCSAEFTFSSGEQEHYAQLGFTNDPKRCPSCRAARKAQSGGDGRRSPSADRGGFSSGPRQMHPAVCAQCGNQTQVPFQPRGDRPVYCSDCFNARR